jgi:hypothetical protein
MIEIIEIDGKIAGTEYRGVIRNKLESLDFVANSSNGVLSENISYCVLSVNDDDAKVFAKELESVRPRRRV